MINKSLAHTVRNMICIGSAVFAISGGTFPSLPTATAQQATAAINGVLRVSHTNPRYFTDDSGRAIYLAGAQSSFEMQDDAWGGWQAPGVHVTSAFTHYLDILQSHNQNLLRFWSVETSGWDTNPSVSATPMRYSRTGSLLALDGKPQFDLYQFNQAYFDRLRARTIEAASRGIYVELMLFEGFSSDHKASNGGNPWFGNPFNLRNNINGVNGDGNNDGMGLELHTLAPSDIPFEYTALQKAYVEKVIDTVNDLDNVIYEIANESTADSKAWQYDMISYIKNSEATRAKQHPVLMSISFDQSNNDLFASGADAIAPGAVNGDYFNNPPSATGQKVIIADSDHIDWTSNDPHFVWRNFMRGNNPVIFDWNLVPFDWNTGRIVADDGSWDPIRRALGDTRTYADKMNLIAMTPQGNLSSTGYVLANAGQEYLVYRPGTGNFTVNLVAGTYTYEWFNPSTSSITETGSFTAASGNRSFHSPFTGQAALYLKASATAPPDVTPPVVDITAPANGSTVTHKTNVTITATATDNIGVTKVEFYVNNTLKCTDAVGATSYSCLWSVPQPTRTTYSIQAKAYDGAGNTSTSAIISVTAQ